MDITLLEFTLRGEDFALFALESIVVIAELICIGFAYRIGRRYPKLTQQGFREIIIGLTLFMLHNFFDVLDTLRTSRIFFASP